MEIPLRALPRRVCLGLSASLGVTLGVACEGGEPYGAPRGATYTAEEVTVITSGGLSLVGTLTLPNAAESPAPAVITVTGQGSQDRDEYMSRVGEYRPFRQVADTLSSIGIAVLRLDDRGVNRSDPGPPGATSRDLAEDIRSAVGYLRSRQEIDGARIGLVGHSEGGVIAPMVAAADSSVAALVLLAGPAYTLKRVRETALEAVIERTASLSAQEADGMRRRSEREAARRLGEDPWFRAAFEYDPLPTIRHVRAPVLILHGETDTQVTPEQADTLAAALREAGNQDVSVVHLPNTNHLFLEDPDGRAFRYQRLPSHKVQRDALGALADWLLDRLR